MSIEQFYPYHSLWNDLCDHLARVEMARWIVDETGFPRPAVYILGCVDGNRVFGHIALKMQVITIPATDFSGGTKRSLRRATGQPLREMFVQTFAVEADYRRQGHGHALQLAALELAGRFGCHQMRSWSSVDKQANYALKLSLGFAAHPATIETADGTSISGVYFVKPARKAAP